MHWSDELTRMNDCDGAVEWAQTQPSYAASAAAEANARADAAWVAYDVRASYAGDHASPPLPPSPLV